MKKIQSYHVWNDEPAVIINNGNETVTGYYWSDWKWHTANAVEIGFFFGKYDDMDDREISKEEFMSKFGDVLSKLDLG